MSEATITWASGPVLRARIRGPFRIYEAVAVGAQGLLGEVLAEAVVRRGTSFSDYVDANGDAGDNAAHLAVFQRDGEPCPGCGRPVKRAVQGARSTYYCATCQPPPPKRRLR